MSPHLEPIRLARPPIPAHADLRQTPYRWQEQGFQDAEWFLTLEEACPHAALAATRFITACWGEVGGGFEPSAHVLARRANLPMEVWQAEVWPHLAPLFATADTGLLYFMPAVPAFKAGWDLCWSNHQRPLAARAAKARKAAEEAEQRAKAAEAAAGGPERKPKKRQKTAKNSASPVTQSNPVRDSIPPAPGASREAEVRSGAGAAEAAETSASAPPPASEPEPLVERFIALYPHWPSQRDRRDAMARDIRERIWPKFEEHGEAILAGLARQESFLRRPRQAGEKSAPHPASWLENRRWTLDFSQPRRPQQGKGLGNRAAAPSGGNAEPPLLSPQASDEEALAWAVAKLRHRSGGQPTYQMITAAKAAFWWGSRDRSGLFDRLLAACGVEPENDMVGGAAVTPEEAAEVLRRLRKLGLAVLRNPANGGLASAHTGTTLAQVPVAQWRAGLTPEGIRALLDRPDALAAYLTRPGRSPGWIGSAPRQHRGCLPRPTWTTAGATPRGTTADRPALLMRNEAAKAPRPPRQTTDTSHAGDDPMMRADNLYIQWRESIGRLYEPSTRPISPNSAPLPPEERRVGSVPYPQRPCALISQNRMLGLRAGDLDHEVARRRRAEKQAARAEARQSAQTPADNQTSIYQWVEKCFVEWGVRVTGQGALVHPEFNAIGALDALIVMNSEMSGSTAFKDTAIRSAFNRAVANWRLERMDEIRHTISSERLTMPKEHVISVFEDVMRLALAVESPFTAEERAAWAAAKMVKA